MSFVPIYFLAQIFLLLDYYPFMAFMQCPWRWHWTYALKYFHPLFFFCSYYTLLCPLQEFIHPLFMLNSGLNECLVAIKLSSYVLTKPQSFVKLMVKRHVLTDGGMNLLHCFMHLFVKFSDENVLEVFHTYFSLAVFRVGDSCTAIYMPSWTSNWWLNILDWKMSWSDFFCIVYRKR